MDIFILDPNTLSVCSFGIPGEMYIAGPGLAKKYINGNDTKFFDAVFDEQQSSFTRVAENINVPGKIRLYASGDYACYQQDGEDVVIKFLGRRDKEVKINGVRISLDTVEQTLRNLSFIQDAVVIPNNTYNALTAYIIYKDKPVEQTVINKHLQTSLLPSVAYPQHFIPVSAFPHTPNGKIDLNELTQKNKADILTRIDEALDSNESEIRKIWAKVLNIPENQISIHVSYKQLGGDSLTLATLEAVLTEEFSTYIGINLLSNHMTIASLSKQISSLCPDKKSVRLGQDTHQEGRFFFIRRTPNHSPQPSHANTPDANPFITMTPPSSTR
jgi:acyl carrier protein